MLIVNISKDVVTRSGRVPTTLIEYVPFGFIFETNIAPVVELTLIKSVADTSLWPSELSKPEYFHVLEYDPQLTTA